MRPKGKPRVGLFRVLFAAGLAIAILASWVAVDPRSADAFAFPKRLLVEAGLALAAIAAAGELRPRRRDPLLWALVAVGLAGFLASGLGSRHPAARDGLMAAALLALAVPIGASESFSRDRSWWTGLYLAGGALNGVLAVLAGLEIYSPTTVFGESKRAGLGALVGNSGQLAIALGVAATVAFAVAAGRTGKTRLAAAAALAILLAGLFATQNLTGLFAAAVGASLFAAIRFRRGGRIVLAAAAILVTAVFLLPAVRSRFARVAGALRAGDWNSALTARAAPWLAAGGMIREHPLLGVGPGAFGAEFVPARLAAEARGRRRIVLPGLSTASFSEAHDDYLEALASIGVPAGLALIAAFALVMVRAWRAGRAGGPGAMEAAVLAAGAVAAIVWFPLQIPSCALAILACAGRAAGARAPS